MNTLKLVALALVFTLHQGAFAQSSAEDWLNEPNRTEYEKPYQYLSNDFYVEILASKLPDAIHRGLKDAPVVALGENHAGRFTGRDFHCPDTLHPFLIRAVYSNGMAGSFSVFQYGRSVSVQHGSMGRITGYNKSALIVCLRDMPDVVYTVVTSAL